MAFSNMPKSLSFWRTFFQSYRNVYLSCARCKETKALWKSFTFSYQVHQNL